MEQVFACILTNILFFKLTSVYSLQFFFPSCSSSCVMIMVVNVLAVRAATMSVPTAV